MYSLYDHTRNFKLKEKYQQYGPCFQDVFPFQMTMHKYIIYLRKKCGFLLLLDIDLDKKASWHDWNQL